MFVSKPAVDCETHLDDGGQQIFSYFEKKLRLAFVFTISASFGIRSFNRFRKELFILKRPRKYLKVMSWKNVYGTTWAYYILRSFFMKIRMNLTRTLQNRTIYTKISIELWWSWLHFQRYLPNIEILKIEYFRFGGRNMLNDLGVGVSKLDDLLHFLICK